MNKIIDFLTHKTKLVGYAGYYRDKPVYEKQRRWWLLQWDKLADLWRQQKEKRIPEWLSPPSGRPTVYTECFDRVNLHTDIPRLYRRLEEQGAFAKDPKYRKSMDIKMEGLKKRPPVVIDYQKTGHPVRDF